MKQYIIIKHFAIYNNKVIWEIEITSINMNFFSKKVYNTSCRARRICQCKGPKALKMFYQPLGQGWAPGRVRVENF